MKAIITASISRISWRREMPKVPTSVSLHNPRDDRIHASSTDVLTRSANEATRSQAARVGG